jgi:hypothetical protein
MKTLFTSLLIASLTLQIYALEEEIPEYPYSVPTWESAAEEEMNQFNPFSISGTYLALAPAEFRSPDVKGDHLTYHQGNVAFAYTQPFNPYWGLIFGAGYVETEVKWKENPDFDQTHFGYVNVAFGAFTKAMPDWRWNATVTAFIDTSVLDLSEYALYQGVLWGRYEFLECLSFDAGFILEVGLNKGKMWPLLGFEYAPYDHWRIMAVYPIDISFEYDVFKCLTIEASIRFLRDRHRVKDTEPLPMGIYEYHTTGVEFDVTYMPWDCLFVKGFVGSAFKGDLKITDRYNHNPHHFKFGSAPYVGGNVILVF